MLDYLVGPSISIRVLKNRKGRQKRVREGDGTLEAGLETCSIAGLEDGRRGSWGKQWGQQQKNVNMLCKYLLN